MWKKSFKISIKLLAFFLVFTGVEKGCNHLTKGFRYQELLSNIPNDPHYETWALLSHEEQKIHEILNQPFTYMGKGGQCAAFVSKDEKYVLKFFRHSHTHPIHKFLKLPLPSFFKKAVGHYFRRSLKYPEPLFPSFKLSMQECANETGFLYLHLNKTKKTFNKATLIDKCGIVYSIDLDATEFALQKKAAPLFATFTEKIANEGERGAKDAVYQILSCYKNLCQKGIKDRDGALRRNIGFLEDRAVVFDTGSFYRDEEVKDPYHCKMELEKKGSRILRWIKKYHPEILNTYQEQMNRVLGESI